MKDKSIIRKEIKRIEEKIEYLTKKHNEENSYEAAKKIYAHGVRQNKELKRYLEELLYEGEKK